jgi:transcriptional regulator with XRE-family HTH domain
MNLREWRKMNGWRQEDVADKIGEPRPTYQAWESGRVSFPPAAQLKIRKLGFTGTFPDLGKPITASDLESIRDEVRNQAMWLRVELQKENTALAAMMQEILIRLAHLQGKL